MSTSSSTATADTASDLLNDLIQTALGLGADAADALMVDGVSLSVSQRLGKREDLERAEGNDLGLRVFIGKRQAIVSSTDTSADTLKELVERAVAMAKVATEDPFCGLADQALLAHQWSDLDLYDSHECTAEELYDRAAIAEDAARAHPGITNSEGADASWSANNVHLATSHGFSGSYRSSSYSISSAVVAGEGTEMERDYDYSLSRHLSDLEDPALVGRRAGERTVKRLNPRKAETAQVPVIFDPRISGGILGHFASAVTGPAVARGTSFLKDHMDQQVFSPNITLIDDPHRLRGLASKPFDGEGVSNQETVLAEAGVLKTWILDSASARQLGQQTTGHARRGTSSPPSPATTNLYMTPGDPTPDALLETITSGFYVTELIGFGVNQVTGDYSRGAAGYWIEKGEITYPVSEVTIAGNLKDMFMHLTPANDLEFRYATNAPTLRIDGMTVAGA
ncbi:MAG: modulator protein [Alphaproteobacteria bacterium]|nr:modulator protein [Alphaproteobacteria bacterium]|tara:strand:- start:2053 stop:3414 length:1362 start_codon:yes stop_codon:yes gene_type:complete